MFHGRHTVGHSDTVSAVLETSAPSASSANSDNCCHGGVPKHPALASQHYRSVDCMLFATDLFGDSRVCRSCYDFERGQYKQHLRNAAVQLASQQSMRVEEGNSSYTLFANKKQLSVHTPKHYLSEVRTTGNSFDSYYINHCN